MSNIQAAIGAFIIKYRTLLLSILVIMMLSTAAVYYIYSNEKAVLANNLEPKEAAEMVSKLKEMGIAYQVGDGGQSIHVNKEIVDSVRMDLLAKGIRTNDIVGFELFDNSDVGLTDFSQHINYQRALEGEITRTLESIPNIEQVRVHLSLPEKNSILAKSDPVKASVKVSFLHGLQPSAKQVDGIRHLVSAAVEGLEQDRVTVIGFDGIALSKSHTDSNVTLEDDNQQNQLQAALKNNIIKILGPSFGEKNISISIVTEFDYDRRKEITRKLIPNSSSLGFIKSRKVDSSNSSDDDVNKKNNKNTHEEFVYGDGYYENVKQQASLRRLSVAVAIYNYLDKQTSLKVESLIKAAVGFNSHRGDQLAIQSLSAKINSDVLDIGAAITPLSRSMPNIVSASKASNDYINQEDFSFLSQGGTIKFLLSLIIFVSLTAIYLFSRRSINKTMSASERDKLLGEIKSWLEIESMSVGDKS